MFVTSAFFVDISRIARRKIRPTFVRMAGQYGKFIKVAYDYIGIFVVKALLGYGQGAFIGLSLTRCQQYMGTAMGWTGHMFLGAFFAVLMVLPTPREPREDKLEVVKPKEM